MATEFVTTDWNGRQVRLEYQWVGVQVSKAPVMLFLHEGLGSVSMWRGFPEQLCQTLECRGLVYSRPGYGRSTPRTPGEKWAPDFMHRQANEVLPAFLRAVGVEQTKQPLWLFGHSDGGTIALLYAARRPQRLMGMVVVAPHIFVEDMTLQSIAQARTAYLKSGLRDRLARYHADPESAFWGWNEAWLDPGFRPWRIDDQIANIQCPLMAIQGVDDEYGSMDQIRGIARNVPQCELLKMNACGHSPHKDQTEGLISAVQNFFKRHHKGDLP